LDDPLSVAFVFSRYWALPDSLLNLARAIFLIRHDFSFHLNGYGDFLQTNGPMNGSAARQLRRLHYETLRKFLAQRVPRAFLVQCVVGEKEHRLSLLLLRPRLKKGTPSTKHYPHALSNQPYIRCPLLASVGYSANSFLFRAVSATEEYSVGFYSMADYFTAAVRTLRRHGLNCTLKTIKKMRFARCTNLEFPIIVIATGFTACHQYFPPSQLTRYLASFEDNYASDVP
jgi:hypothetical protein